MRKLLLLLFVSLKSILAGNCQVITDNRVLIPTAVTGIGTQISSAACQGDKLYVSCIDDRFRIGGHPAIAKINTNGDTAWYNIVDAEPGISSIAVKNDRIYLFNVSGSTSGPPDYALPGMDFFVFDTMGNQLARTVLMQDSVLAPNPSFGKVVWLTDSVLLIAGNRGVFGSPLRGWMMAVNTRGQLVWQRYYRPIPGALADFTDVTLVQGGLIRACINIGRNVWISYFNAVDGSLVSERNLYTNPLPYSIFAVARRAPNNRWVIATQSSAGGGVTDKRFVVIDDAGRTLVSKQIPIWARPTVSSDGHVFYDNASFGSTPNLNRIYTYKLDIDSLREVWRADHIASYSDPTLRPHISESSQYFFDGHAGLRTVGAFGFYTARISNAGYEYQDPEAVTATQERVAVKPYPVPNPAGGSVSFAGFEGRGALSLTGVDGRLWLTRQVAAGAPVDLAALPAGLFVYRLTVNGKTHTGRLVHEGRR